MFLWPAAETQSTCSGSSFDRIQQQNAAKTNLMSANLQSFKFFVSYARECELSLKLAKYLKKKIKECGHEVFVDMDMEAGDKWSEEIEKRLDRWCDYVIIILSEKYNESDVALSEVRRANQREERENRQIFLPVRIQSSDYFLGVELDSYMGSLQYSTWSGDSDSDLVVTQILRAASKRYRSSNTQTTNISSEFTDHAIKERLLAFLQGMSHYHATAAAAFTLIVAGVVGYVARYDASYREPIADPTGGPILSFILSFRYEIAIFSLLVIFLSSIGRKNLQRKRLIAVFLHSENFFLEYLSMRDRIKSTYRQIPYNEEIDQDKRISLIVEFDKYLKRSANILHELFSEYARDRCHVAIKTYNKNEDEITTQTRDRSSPERDMIDKNDDERIRPYHRNSAFTEILENPRCGFFYSNWLHYRAVFNNYYSGHSGWQKFYKAAIIVPITQQQNNRLINKENIWGFICVDNMKGRFNGKDCAALLFVFARAYSELFELIGRIQPDRSAMSQGRPQSGDRESRLKRGGG